MTSTRTQQDIVAIPHCSVGTEVRGPSHASLLWSHPPTSEEVDLANRHCIQVIGLRILRVSFGHVLDEGWPMVSNGEHGRCETGGSGGECNVWGRSARNVVLAGRVLSMVEVRRVEDRSVVS